MDAPGIALRFALFLDLLLLVGLAGFLWRGGDAGREMRSRAMLVVLAGSGILLSVAGLVALAAAMAGVPVTQVDRATIGMLLIGTAAGTAWIVRIAALVAAMLLARRPGAAGVAGAVALATLAWSGHGAMDAGPRGLVHLVADIAHLLAAAGWLGTLAALLFLLARRPQADRVAVTHDALAGFAGVGTVLVALVVATGVVNGWLLLGWPGWSQLAGSTYGRLLLAKIALFAAMLVLAGLNRFRLTPALAVQAADPRGAWRALRRSVAIESGCGVAVVALVAWLGTLEPTVAAG